MKASDKKVEVVRLFLAATKNVKHLMRSYFENKGITLPQGMVIGTLIESGEMKITELSKKLNLSNSTISGIVDRLEKQQLVVRTRSEEDRRIVYVCVTPKVKEMHEGIHKKVEDNIAELLSSGTPDELLEISVGLTTLNKILEHRN